MKDLGLSVSEKKIYKDFIIKVYGRPETPGAGPFLTPGHNLNNLGRGPLGDVTYQTRSRPLSFREEDYQRFFYHRNLWETRDPLGGSISTPRGII